MGKRQHFFALAFSTCLFSAFAVCTAATLHVPADQPTIQDGILAAASGDVVLVAAGTYYENIDYLGKSITVRSSDGPETTAIDGGSVTSVVTFENNEVDAVIEGFTIRNGKKGGSNHGNGIFCYYASPVIRNNIIYYNFGQQEWRGGIACYYGSVVIEDNLVIHNVEGGISGLYTTMTLRNNLVTENIGTGVFCFGGSCEIVGNTVKGNWGDYATGIFLNKCSPVAVESNEVSENDCWNDYSGGLEAYQCIGGGTVSDNLIRDNKGVHGGLRFENCYNIIVSGNVIRGNRAYKPNYYNPSGGGISVYTSSNSHFINNTIIENTALLNGGGIHFENSNATCSNNILWGNSASHGDAIYIQSGSPTITYCDVEGGWPGDGNLDADPCFVDGEGGDFHLLYTSPCRDAGDNAAVMTSADFEGDPRIAEGSVDIGADEFYRHFYVTGDKTPGGEIEGRFIGLPGTEPLALFLGSGVLEQPANTPWGPYFLKAPWWMIPLVPLQIPSDGMLGIPATIPPEPAGVYDLPMQALIGLNSESLSNLEILEVR